MGPRHKPVHVLRERRVRPQGLRLRLRRDRSLQGDHLQSRPASPPERVSRVRGKNVLRPDRPPLRGPASRRRRRRHRGQRGRPRRRRHSTGARLPTPPDRLADDGRRPRPHDHHADEPQHGQLRSHRARRRQGVPREPPDHRPVPREQVDRPKSLRVRSPRRTRGTARLRCRQLLRQPAAVGRRVGVLQDQPQDRARRPGIHLQGDRNPGGEHPRRAIRQGRPGRRTQARPVLRARTRVAGGLHP